MYHILQLFTICLALFGRSFSDEINGEWHWRLAPDMSDRANGIVLALTRNIIGKIKEPEGLPRGYGELIRRVPLFKCRCVVDDLHSWVIVPVPRHRLRHTDDLVGIPGMPLF